MNIVKKFKNIANIIIHIDQEDGWETIYLNGKILNEGRVGLRKILDDPNLCGYDEVNVRLD
jgi:hypothetical protein